ncbi:hypothetical protein [Pedobacter cryotolerans]|uniref:Uncharacterized protein n=1 Tax=Pedobacter cryotolerans TaxID=2571270 RepID=A0A4U1C065_9SPHI|nr:hypothetical protein [Pedobacter cryotolerans]TKB98248.1 hypothetical protein FA045_14805 [Pedobacter cryotolerans]
MKKLFFIIPKVILRYLVFLNFLVFCSYARAQVYGCHVVVGVSDRIFYTPYGAGSPTEWQTVVGGAITATGETGGYRSDGSVTYGCIADIGGTCTVYQQYEISAGPPQIIGMRPYRVGVYASIDPVNCPIDNYIPLLFIFTIGITLIKFKKVVPL